MKRLGIVVALSLVFAGRLCAQDLVSEVHLPMGVAGPGNCTIGPQLPHGSSNPAPDTPDGGHDGYHPERPIRGFSQLHVSGTGWGQYGNMLISPQIGLATGASDHDSAKRDEHASPDLYGVTLTRWNIRAEVTPTHWGAVYRFTYPQSDDAHLLLDAAHSIATDIEKRLNGRFYGGMVEVTSLAPLIIEARGKYQGGFGHGPYEVFAVVTCDRDAQEAGTWADDKVQPGQLKQEGAGRIGAFARFDTRENPVVQARVGVSLGSMDRARAYARDIVQMGSFDEVRAAARAIWNEKLGSLAVEGGTPQQRRLFYTGLYHSLLMPRDRTGDNARWTSDEPFWDDHYAVWDTWRTAMPLRMLIDTDAMRGIVRSMIDRHEHGGRVADAFVAGVESADQGGNGPDNVIADAFVKGLTGVDWDRAWALLEKHALAGRNERYRKLSWIPAGRMSCSDTLEMAYQDACAAQVAAGLGKKQMAEQLLQRSRGWRQLWRADLVSDGYSGFVAPRRADGTWVEEFDPRKVHGSWENFFYEGSSWNYSFFAPHDVEELIKLCGGRERFAERLEYACEKRLVEMWNEPAFLTLRLFAYAGRPDLVSKWVHHNMRTGWNLQRGYPGNEDSGAMGSWYVWSAMGVFPVAGQDLYILNAPVFTRSTIKLEGGKTFVIEAPAASEKNVHIVGASLNGEKISRAYLRHHEIVAGGTLLLEMGEQPSDWGTQELPPSLTID